MDYNLEIMLVALVAHRAHDGGGEESVTRYAADVFDRFDRHILTAVSDAGVDDLTPDQRTVIAALATFAPGTTPEDCALAALTTYVELFAH